MSLEGKLFGGVAAFFLPVTLVYWFTSKDPTGTTALALAFGLSSLISIYLLYTASRIDPRPEDNPHADVSDGAGDIGFFSPHSWWPITAAGGAAFAFLGVAIGLWMVLFALPFILLGVFGFVFEYYRGENARH
jgi:hypothetical protein